MGNFRPIPYQLSTKWAIVRRYSQSVTKEGSQRIISACSTGSEEQHTKTGKFLKKKWFGKAGAGWTLLSVLDWWLIAAGGWLTWRGVFMRWTPLGICLIAAAQWHLHNKAMDKKGLPRTATKWQVNKCSIYVKILLCYINKQIRLRIE